MDDDILSKVVEVEKEVQQRIKIEEKMSQEWLENAKSEAEEKVLIEEKELKRNVHESIGKARLNAEIKAEAITRDANSEAKRLEKLDDDTLKKIISKHIIKILPGT
jgi:vacuolar-type H+-ATPase subunit H